MGIQIFFFYICFYYLWRVGVGVAGVGDGGAGVEVFEREGVWQNEIFIICYFYAPKGSI